MNGDSTTPSWYYAKTGAVDGQQVGPVSWEQLVSLAQTGALAATDLVWNPQFPSWVTVTEVPGLLAPPLPRMGTTPQEVGRPPVGQPTAVRPGTAVQPTAARPGAIQPAPRQAARPASGYDPFLDEGEPDDFGGQRSWLRWGMAIGAVVVIGIIVGVYFGVIKGGGATTTTTLAPTTSVSETTTTEAAIPVPQAMWTDLALTGTLPSARSDHAFAYDQSNRLVILFGGWNKAGVASNDTWTFDSTLLTWTKVTIAGKLPPARAQHQMVYDPGTAKVILFGGISKKDGTQLKDIWAYDPAAKTWKELKPVGSAPSARSSFSMAYDASAQKIILFGGFSKATSARLNDTWAYDPAANTWAKLSATGDVPSVRDGSAMTYDPAESKIVLFGGSDGTAYLNDTYLLDSASGAWTKVVSAGGSPAIRAGHSMTFDPVSGNVVLFGGWDGTSFYNDTWTFSVGTSTWTALELTDAPSARYGHALIVDEPTNQLILFGGLVGGADVAQDTWSFGITEEDLITDETLPETETSVIDGTSTTLAP